MARARKTAATARAPDFIPFQLVKLVSTPPAGNRWLHEIKFDGYRIQVRVEATGRASTPATAWTGPTSFPA